MITAERRSVLNLIAGGFFSKAALSWKLDTPERVISNRLRWLRDRGFAETVCGGRAAKWRATKDGEKLMEASTS